MKEIKIPELAESVTEGTVAEWLVKKGDQIKKGDPVLELETDKVNVEVNSDYEGVVAELLVEAGDDVQVGDTVAKVDESGEISMDSSDEAEGDSKQEESKSKQDSKQEDSSEEKEDSKEAPVKKQSKDEEKSSIGDEKSQKEVSSEKGVIASPAARKRARELGINLKDVYPKDPLGRIRPEDVEESGKSSTQKSGSGQAKSSSNNSSSSKSESKDKTEFQKPVERIKMSRRRMTIAKRLVEAQQSSAMLTTFNEVDMTNVMKLRKERKDDFEKKHGVRLGFMSFFTKSVIGALKDFPLLNAEIQGDEIVVKKFYDIGMAVSTEGGLVVPVVRDADRLGFAGIEKEVGRLAEKARDKKLSLDDLQGGSFTITNGGVFGSLLSTPILNTPQVGILGMHKIEKRAVVMPDDTIEVRPMMYLALSYDHRIVDGREAVQFLVRVKELLEDPYDLLLEG
ncbi:2-oxoglutarate dehydrogenase complex dihydrolipoyllysine-residue succinyltransferase [Bacillaceae bacterium S4-13-58]